MISNKIFVMDKFLTDIFTENEANVIVFGVPLGKAKRSVESFRSASWFVEMYDVDKKMNILEKVKTFDKGNVRLDDVAKMRKEISSQNKVSLMISDSHFPTFQATRNFKGKLLIFDGHNDLYDSYSDKKIVALTNSRDKKQNDATWLRRLVEESNIEVFIVGLRSANEDTMKFIEEENIQFATASDVRNNLQKVKDEVRGFTKSSSLYVSLDIDVFDPSIAPGVDYPEPGGILFSDFQGIVANIDGKIKGIDVCCMKDDEVTNFLAVRSVFELMSRIY
jgi:agmatinase